MSKERPSESTPAFIKENRWFRSNKNLPNLPPSINFQSERQGEIVEQGVFLHIPRDAVLEFQLDVVQTTFDQLQRWIESFASTREYVWGLSDGGFVISLPRDCALELYKIYGAKFPEIKILPLG